MNKRPSQIFVFYVWEHRYPALLFLAFTGIFASVFSLYNLELEAVWYAAGLCLVLSVLVLLIHFSNYCKKHKNRKQLQKNIQLATEQLPPPQTLAEADYQEMILQLKRTSDTALTEWETKYQESIDYYTTWVHQIKTPISVMRMILQTEDTAEYRELSDELFRIEQYVEMVLSYLRLGSQSSDFVFREYSLDHIIRQAVHKYAPQFVRKRIRLSYTPTDATVLTDEKWLLFIIEQLLSNAIKYTPSGTVTITVTDKQVLNIADTGIGIAPEDIPRIFEKGFTGYNGRADKKSTGLGLYLCSQAAYKLSYKLHVTSDIGTGSVFSIDLHRNHVNTMP